MNITPEMIINSKRNVCCEDCRYYARVELTYFSVFQYPTQCHHPSNIETRQTPERKYQICKEHPYEKNSDNQCKYFKKPWWKW